MPDWFNDQGAVDSVLIGDRAFQYGDGLFETIAIRNGEPRLWQYHMDRLAKGCARLAIKMPAKDSLMGGIQNALRLGTIASNDCVTKIILSAGHGDRGYGRRLAETPYALFGVFAATVPPRESYRSGIETVLCETRLGHSSATAGLKTLNRLEQVLARSEFIDADVFEGLTMDVDDNIICGTMSNLFAVSGDTIATPSLAQCGVEGVMRRHLIETLSGQGILTETRTITLADLENSDEIFISNSQFGVLPVRRCNEMHWPVGKITEKTMAIMADSGVTECRS